MADKKISRRSFLQSTALIGGAAMIPSLLMGGNAGAGNKRVAPPKGVGANEKVGFQFKLYFDISTGAC